jgi:transcriptional regulator with XRE-family HTH domain
MADPKPDSALVERLRQAVRESGRSLSELGRQAGLDHGRLSRFMRGERDLTLSAAARLCAVVGLCLVPTASESAPPQRNAPAAKKGQPRKGK